MSPSELLNLENRPSEVASKIAPDSSDNNTYTTVEPLETVRDPWDLEPVTIGSTLDDLESEDNFSWNPYARGGFEKPVFINNIEPNGGKKVLSQEEIVPEVKINTQVDSKKLKDFIRLNLAIFETEIEKLQVPASMQIWVDNYRLILHKATKEKDARDYAAKLNLLYTRIANFNNVEARFGSASFDDKVLEVVGGFENRLLVEAHKAKSLKQFSVYTKQLQQLFIAMKENDLGGVQAVIDNKDLRRALPENFFRKSVAEKVAPTWKDRLIGFRDSFTNIFTSKKEKKPSPKNPTNKIQDQVIQTLTDNSTTPEVSQIDEKLILETINKVESREFFEVYLKQTKYPNLFKDLIADLRNSNTNKERRATLHSSISIIFDMVNSLDGLNRDLKTAINFEDVGQVKQLTEDYNSKQKDFFTLMCQIEQSINFKKKAKVRLMIPEIVEPELEVVRFVPFSDIRELVLNDEIQPFRELWDTINTHPNKEKVYQICMMIKKFLLSLHLMKIKKLSGLEIREYIIYNSLNIKKSLDEMNMNYFFDLLEDDLGFGPKKLDDEIIKKMGSLTLDEINQNFS